MRKKGYKGRCEKRAFKNQRKYADCMMQYNQNMRICFRNVKMLKRYAVMYH